MSEDTKHAELMAIGENAYGAIRDMVRACSLNTAAEDYVADLTVERCVALLVDAECEFDPESELDDLRELVAEHITDGVVEPDDFEFDEDAAVEAIHSDPLSVEVRSGWHEPGASPSSDEFCILLSTGGPAVRIIGDLDGYCEPTRATLQVQDWFTPWTDYHHADSDILLEYCRHFHFGE